MSLAKERTGVKETERKGNFSCSSSVIYLNISNLDCFTVWPVQQKPVILFSRFVRANFWINHEEICFADYYKCYLHKSDVQKKNRKRWLEKTWMNWKHNFWRNFFQSWIFPELLHFQELSSWTKTLKTNFLFWKYFLSCW